ncbi:tRNA/rRNA methyltransferase SpoU family protein [Prunus dulcis]|uniref:tRNA/rRNA methyltransferase SpoU family protein n=1 Tax=Prunus dulcis TaxID=3755 RepID=A0A4Y1RH76_PRUDU|nr:tRNA/rRNA methyltransferase SpoU family protein [Prunus dulcis]
MVFRGFFIVNLTRLFDVFLGSSSIWQPQPCRDHHHSSLPVTTDSVKTHQDEFADENINSNINIFTNQMGLPQHKNIKQVTVEMVGPTLLGLHLSFPCFVKVLYSSNKS